MDVLSKENVRLLLTIGFAACAKGKVAAARRLFLNLEAAYPEAEPVKVGLAFSHLVVDDFEKAESLLNEVIASGDETQEALALLTFSKALQKKGDEAQELALKVRPEHEAAWRLAQEALKLAD